MSPKKAGKDYSLPYYTIPLKKIQSFYVNSKNFLSKKVLSEAIFFVGRGRNTPFLHNAPHGGVIIPPDPPPFYQIPVPKKQKIPLAFHSRFAFFEY
jgi:hypothetical protein